MKSFTSSGWRISLAAATLAVAIGAGLAWSQTTPPAPAPAVVSPENHAAAIEAFKKARDLLQQEKYAEANVENDKALQLDPNLDDAKILRRIVQSKLAAGPATESSTTAGGLAEKVRLLKPSDISLIRFKEMTSDDKLKGRIDPKVLRSFWDDVVRKSETDVTADAEQKFLNPANFEQQVQKIRDADQVAYMEKVEFNSDPAVLLAFKKTIEPYVLANCATAQCHAGPKAGSFRLIRPPNTAGDQAVYTNFYILSTYAGRDGKMIDRDQPERSLLVQYALPKTATSTPHPKVDIPVRFKDANAPEFQSIVAWIKGLAFPRPNYGIIYEVPGPAPLPPPPATQPATRPATTRPAK